MLSEEEQNAVDFLNECITKDYLFEEDFTLYNIKILVNLITKLKKENEEVKQAINVVEKEKKQWIEENEKKDKQIDLMAKYIDNNNYVDSEECQFQWDFKIEECIKKGDCKDCIKNYYEKLAKDNMEV